MNFLKSCIYQFSLIIKLFQILFISCNLFRWYHLAGLKGIDLIWSWLEMQVTAFYCYYLQKFGSFERVVCSLTCSLLHWSLSDTSEKTFLSRRIRQSEERSSCLSQQHQLKVNINSFSHNSKLVPHFYFWSC